MTDGSFVVGLDLGGTQVKAGLVDRDGEIRSRWESDTGNGYDAILDRLSAAVDAVDPHREAKGIGLGCPGPLDPTAGMVLEAPNLPGLSGRTLVADLQQRCERAVCLENDANAAAVGEWWVGGGRGRNDVVVITLGTGVGGGLILGGRLWSGQGHIAGEIGHMCIDPDGPPCGCGGYGCLETFASGPAIVRSALRRIKEGEASLLERWQSPELTPKAVSRACDDEDPVARRVMADAGKVLGIACANLVNLLSPECILVGGGVSEAGEYLLGPARQAMSERLFDRAKEFVVLDRAVLGNDAGIVGAAKIAWEAMDHQ